MAATINVHDAKTHFSKLLERVALGEEIVIAKAGQPVATLSSIPPKRTRSPGGAEGLVVPDSFFEVLPASLQQHFE